ncbi:hypothetical protein [Moraxella caviae]
MKRADRLRQLPCCNCGVMGVDIAHSNFYEHGKGKGVKAHDDYTIPLCRKCHYEFDTYQSLKREQAKAWFLEKLAFVNRAF